MVKFEELFKRELYQDTIKPLIDDMDMLSEGLEYENAQIVLENIKKELKESKSNFPFDILTIKDVYDMIISHPIRLCPEDYSFSDFLGLIVSVHKRKGELKGGKYSDIDRQRKIVAEEMVKLGIVIPSKWKGIKPNRRFLDIAHGVNPFIANKELERRERVILWKAIENGHTDKIKESVGKIKRLRKC